MIRLIREKAIENPWLFRGIMGFLAISFAISLAYVGGDGNNKEHDNVIAEIDQDTISIEEYRRVYKNMARFYRQILKDQFDEKKFRKQVIDLLVEQKLWIHEADRLNLRVTDSELRDSLLAMPGFQKNGQFNTDIYRRALVAEHLSPEKFERQQREELVVKKAKTLIRQSSALTPSETADIERLNPADMNKERENSLAQKQEKALRAYTVSLKEKAVIFIKEELL
jgi:peptidyl-prolyl cis-trans isomerase D